MIVFGSRGSELALWQTRHIAALLRERTGEEARVEVIETRGDRVLDQPLPTIGGKGLFTAELEAALHEGRIDVAVHSMKDLPVENPAGLTIGAVPPRAAAADVLVYDPAHADPTQPIVPLRAGSRVGTSSHRRRSALAGARPDLTFADVRGNVPTRVDKVRRGDYHGVVLASAGLDRLALDLRGLQRHTLPLDVSTPAPAQGALAVQCRADDARVRALLQHLHDEATARCAHAERELLAQLGGGCSMPLGALVEPTARGHRLQVALFANPTVNPTPGGAVRIVDEGPDLAAMVARAATALRPLVGDPLAGRMLVLLRPDGEGGELAAQLHVAGAHVTTIAITRTEPLPLDRAALPGLLRDRALCFTSARAVAPFVATGVDLRGVPIFAGGPATAALLRAHGLAAAVAEQAGGEALAQLVAATGVPARGVLFPCAVDRHDAFERTLAARGIAVHALPTYRTLAATNVALAETPATTLVFSSPSAVRAYVDARLTGPGRRVAIGPTTAAAMRERGVRCDAVAAAPTAAALIRALLEHSDV